MAWKSDGGASPFPLVDPADVVVEAFACNPPASYVAAMAAKQPKPVWINLEFLSAESWVLGCHGLPSPHPSLAAGEIFFLSGFCRRHRRAAGGAGFGTGARAVSGLQHAEQARFWQDLGLPAPRAGELQVSLFCYPHDGISALLRAWAAGGTPVRCLVPEGIATAALSAFFGTDSLAPGAILRKAGLEVRIFPFLDQDQYDRLLWACDLNLVRGEDSFVRAQWAARPLLWQIYPQQEAAHQPKLQAFLELYCAGLAAETTAAVSRLWQAWNKGDDVEVEAAWPGFWQHKVELQEHARRWARQLAATGDLANNLAQFCDNLLK